MRIAIVGGGIIGVSTAIAVQQAFPEYRLTIVADVWTPGTTGDGSAGLWGPSVLGPDTPERDFIRWGGSTHRWLEEHWRSPIGREIGVSRLPVTRVTRKDGWTMPAWKAIVHDAAQLTDRELKIMNDEHKTNYKNGMTFVSYTAEPTKLLPWMLKRFTSAGGSTIDKTIYDLDELQNDGYDVVINCSGLGARKLVDDLSVEPVRGHVIRVKAPWVDGAFLEEDKPGNYIIPNMDCVIMGGTAQLNDWDVVPREDDEKFIRDGCEKILPALKEAEVIKHWVGLRPFRPRIRLDSEYRHSSITGKKYLVIHNYGHGGSGVTTFWGCALDVVEILKKKTQEEKS